MIRLVANKNVFINNRGSKKTRAFKKGNIYIIENVRNKSTGIYSAFYWKSYKVTGDNGITYWYYESEIKKIFSSLDKSRDSKLDQLGI